MAFGYGFGSEEKVVRHLNKLHGLLKARCLEPELGANALAELF
jgi:hypothetical protein